MKVENKGLVALAVVVVVLLVAVAIEGVEIAALSQQIAFLNQQVTALSVLPGVVSGLESELAILESRTSTTTQAPHYSLKIDSACASKSASCGFQNGTYVYFITIANNGTEALPATYGFAISFKDLTSQVSFTVNSTLQSSTSVQPGAIGVLEATQWPAGTVGGQPYGNFTKGDSLSVVVMGPGGSMDYIAIKAS